MVNIKSIKELGTIRVVLWMLALLSVFALGWYASRFETLREVENNVAKPVRYSDPNFPMISPLVSVSIPNATGFPELKSTKRDVEEIIRKAKATDDVETVGVYFRQPLNAHWFGINENDGFDPGSLIKVPVLMAYLKRAEHDPATLQKKLRYIADTPQGVPNALAPNLKSGSYTVEELLRSMIVDSDNVAKDILIDNIDPLAIQEVFDEMNLNFLKDPSGTITPKQYVIILSRIYNATFLSRYYSNYAMQLLSQASFKDGLVAGLPETVQVAHKYGERGVYEDKELVAIELHDCGLIYAEDDPYYLCIMTKGKNEASLMKTIGDITAAIYSHRNEFKPAQ